MIDWLTHSVTVFGLSAPCWAFLAMLLGVVAEGALGRSKRPEFRSLAALVANGLRLLLTFLRVPSIPVVGPLVVHALEVAANVDLDGDGRIADRTPPPSPPPAVVLLLALALPALSCAHVAPVIHAVEDCAAPAVEDQKANLLPTVVAIFMCSGGSAELLPACALHGLEGLAASLGHDGYLFIDCVVAQLRDGRSTVVEGGTAADVHVRAQAAAWLERRAARGVTVKVAP